MPANSPIYLPYDDYAQSANTLFHFMKKQEYLNSILLRKAIIPRYCIETIDYLNIRNGTRSFNEVAILQKCFCDIPFHKLADSFSWGEKKHLQPVHYLNKDSQYAKDFSALFGRVFKDDDIPEEYSQDVINRLAYIKPLRGIMKRKITRRDFSSATIEICKNFHDECEWRYVPSDEVLTALNTESIIANPYIIHLADEISNGLEQDRYKKLWLDFSYDDIRYIIVPDIRARIEIIKTITDLPDSCFENQDDILMQKNVLISKILVLEEIRRDW